MESNASHQVAAPEAPNLDYRKIALFLWQLLDDIDTADDIFKEDHVAFQKYTYRKQQRRWEVSSSDGCEITFISDNATPSDEAPPAQSPSGQEPQS